MRFSQPIVSTLLLIAAGAVQAASSWTFDDATLAVTSKKGADGAKQSLSSKAPLSKVVSVGAQDTVKVSLTTKEDGKGKRPHQAFLVLKEEESGLEAPFPLTVKDNGKAIVSIAQKDIPVQLLLSQKAVRASIILASFGSAEGLESPLFSLEFNLDPNAPAPKYEKPLRYGKLPELAHTFRADPRNPPKIVSLVFALAVLATVPALLIGWLVLGANLNHLQKAMGAAPASHAAFFGSIIAMEGVFFMYYTSWTLFQTLPVITVVGVVALLSGSKALGEVQSRRLAGER